MYAEKTQPEPEEVHMHDDTEDGVEMIGDITVSFVFDDDCPECEAEIEAVCPRNMKVPSNWTDDACYGDLLRRNANSCSGIVGACESDKDTAIAALIDGFERLATEDGLPPWPIAKIVAW